MVENLLKSLDDLQGQLLDFAQLTRDSCLILLDYLHQHERKCAKPLHGGGRGGL